jgi:Glycosyl transferase family 11.
MVIVKLSGGLGNQLFQYAFGRSLAIKNETELKLDVRGYDFFSADTTPRRFALAPFNIGAGIASRAEIGRVIGIPQNDLGRMFSRFLMRHGWYHNPRHLRALDLNLHENFLDLPGNIYLEGQFQSEKYFIKNSEVIRNAFSLKPEFAEILQSPIADEIKNSNSVFIHFRDYANDVSALGSHGNSREEYFSAAIKIIKEKIANPTFFVFSENLDWCRKNFPSDANLVFVEAHRDYEDLILMSQCRHAIISNSSFSWWAAWLIANPDKIVIAPQRWFSEEKFEAQTENLVPKGWIRI